MIAKEDKHICNCLHMTNFPPACCSTKHWANSVWRNPWFAAELILELKSKVADLEACQNGSPSLN